MSSKKFNYELHDDLCRIAIKYRDGLGYLRLYVSNPELKKIYQETAKKHNNDIILSLSDKHPKYPKSCFDLYTPKETVFTVPFKTKFVDLGVKCEMFNCHKDYISSVIYKEMVYVPTAFYMYPHSNISKTPLMLANHTGIIDLEYRKSLIAAVRYLPESIVMEQNDEEFENNIENDVILRKHVTSYTLEKYTCPFQVCHPSLRPIYVEVLDENGL